MMSLAENVLGKAGVTYITSRYKSQDMKSPLSLENLESLGTPNLEVHEKSFNLANSEFLLGTQLP